MIAALQALKDSGAATNADFSRVISQPSSRIAELFKGDRMLKVDEMKMLIDRYNINSEAAPAPSAEGLEPILDALWPLAPPGPLSGQSRRALAGALSYGLGLLGSNLATPASSDALAVAARAAAARFRETAIAS
jgi:hypothetical protein